MNRVQKNTHVHSLGCLNWKKGLFAGKISRYIIPRKPTNRSASHLPQTRPITPGTILQAGRHLSFRRVFHSKALLTAEVIFRLIRAHLSHFIKYNKNNLDSRRGRVPEQFETASPTASFLGCSNQGTKIFASSTAPIAFGSQPAVCRAARQCGSVLFAGSRHARSLLCLDLTHWTALGTTDCTADYAANYCTVSSVDPPKKQL